MKHLVALVHLLRPHHWVKNGFIVMPMVFTPESVNSSTITAMAYGVLCFCIVSSGVYCFNDLMDVARDRLHPTKQRRPLAAGKISRLEAVIIGALLVGGGMAGAFLVGLAFGWLVVAYVVINVSYSIGLKNFSILDVMIVSLGFVLRVYAGSAIIQFEPSVWIIVCTGLLALLLSLGKRYDDVPNNLDDNHRGSITGYNVPFLNMAMTIVMSAVLVSYIIYSTNEKVIEKLGTDQIFLTIPIVIAGLFRYLQLIFVEKKSGEPTTIILTDRPMYLLVIAWLASILGLVYLG
jgi:decaprenyl-phosphate phosphoribosyltransferase